MTSQPFSASCSGTEGLTIPRTGEETAETRSEEHTSELQSRLHLVCRLLLEKKKEASHSSFLQVTRTPFLNESKAFATVTSSDSTRRRLTRAVSLTNRKLLRRLTRTSVLLSS